ncbi:MAG: hypothetical protein Q7T11_04720, partial [Deltaproteobacteria bacterium]|nr:hypothetical protein [Deltaproteobacteria bacterium]
MEKIDRMMKSLARGKERALPVLNGVVGHTLKKIGLAIPMRLYAGEKPLSLTKSGLGKAGLPAGGKICILAHGNCGSERGWAFKEDRSKDYGSLLQKEFGFTPFFLRYNSGLHISSNGHRLSALLEKLIHSYPVKVSELIL